MFKHLINLSMIFAVMYFGNVLELGNASQQVEQNQLMSRPTEQSPTVGQLPAVEQSAIIEQAQNGDTQTQMTNEGIQPDSVVAISASTSENEPQVFYTKKGAVPDNWRGWFYIMSGADYINYIQNGLNIQPNTQQTVEQGSKQQHGVISNQPHYTPPQISQHIIGRSGGYQRHTPSLRSTNNPVVANNSAIPNSNQQIDISQPTALRQSAVIQQPAVQQLSTAKQAASDTLVKEITGGKKVEQGKPDNEVPEVLIHDGAVYTLANSVEVTNTAAQPQQFVQAQPQQQNQATLPVQQPLLQPQTEQQVTEQLPAEQLPADQQQIAPPQATTIPTNNQQFTTPLFPQDVERDNQQLINNNEVTLGNSNMMQPNINQNANEQTPINQPQNVQQNIQPGVNENNNQ